jgi:ribonucleoside-diphosphate reductase alpha chain
MTDAFMEALRSSPGALHVVVDPHTGRKGHLRKSTGRAVYGEAPAGKESEFLTVRELWDRIVTRAWNTGEPGLIFIDEVNRHNQTPHVFEMRATNPCVTGDTLVYTDAGLVPIATLAKQETVRAVALDARLGSGPWGPAGVPFATGVKPVFRLKTREGYELRLTGDHRVLTSRGWLAAQQLELGDEIHLLDHKGGFGRSGTEAEGRVVGWLVADGHITGESGHGAVLGFWGRDRETLAPAFAADVNAVLGQDPAEARYPVGVVEVESRDLATVSSTRLRALVAEKFGLTAKNKLGGVPPAILASSEACQRGFLAALFTADGHVSGSADKGVTVRLTSVSLPLLRDAQRMLLNFGVASRLYANRHPERTVEIDGRAYDCRADHDLAIGRDNVVRFAEGIGFLGGAKQEELRRRLESYGGRGPYRERFVARFEVLEPLGEEPVFDLTEPLTHSFVANGIVVHNCGEQPLGPYEACNLGSINLERFYRPAVRGSLKERIDWAKLEGTVRTSVRFLDDVVEVNNYPTKEIDEACRSNRKIGLGVMGFADLLFQLGVRYDSEEALQLARDVGGFIQKTAWEAGAELAEQRGCFKNWKGSLWDVQRGMKARNAHYVTIAPTGTISIIAGCSGGIEPIFSLAFTRQVLDGKTLNEVNPVFEQALRDSVKDEAEVLRVIDWAAAHGTIQGCEGVPAHVREVFRTARDIGPEWHVRMQAAWQEHTDAAVSKTINLAPECDVSAVEAAYLLAWELKCKGITVYRDGSRPMQPMALKDEVGKTLKDKASGEARAAAPAAKEPAPSGPVRPVALPEIMPCVRVRQFTPFGNMHVKISVEPSTGTEREVFAQLGKGGDLANSDLEAICRILSLFLRCNGELMLAVGQLDGIGSSLSIATKEGRIKSLADGLAHALRKYLAAKNKFGIKALLLGEMDLAKLYEEGAGADGNGNGHGALKPKEMFKIKCPSCDVGVLAFQEGCVKCHACGFSQC